MESEMTREEFAAGSLYRAARGGDISGDDPTARAEKFLLKRAQELFRGGQDRSQVIAKLTEDRDLLNLGTPDEILSEIVSAAHEIGAPEDGESDHPPELIEEAGGIIG